MKPDSLQDVGGDCNLQFVCDTCVADYKPICPLHINNIHTEIASMKTMLLTIRKLLAEPPTASPVVSETSAMLTNIHDIVKIKSAPSPPADDTFKAEMKSLLIDIKSAVTSRQQPISSPRNIADRRGGNRQQPTGSTSAINNNHPPKLNAPPINTTTPIIERPKSKPNSVHLRLPNSHNGKTVVISHLHPSTTESHIIEYAKSKLGLPADDQSLMAKALIPKGRSPLQLNFVSIKMDVPAELYSRISSPELWPDGVSVREFELRPGKSSSTGVFLA